MTSPCSLVPPIWYLQQMIALGRGATQEKSFRKLEPLVEDLALSFQNHGFYDRLRYSSVMSIGSLSRVLSRAMRAQTERSLVLSAIAVKRFALRHGGPPQSLDALVPEPLRSIPVDYMDGKPIRFRPLPTGGFVLYSVGEDGKDDSGDATLRPGKTNSRMIWDHNDVVWPAPATAKELQAYRAESPR